MTLCVLFGAWLALNVAVTAACLGLAATEALSRRMDARSLLSLHYRVAALAICCALLLPALPAEFLIHPFAHAWTSRDFRFLDDVIPHDNFAAGVIMSTSNLDAGGASRAWIAAALALLALGIAHLARDAYTLRRLRRESQCVRRIGRVRLWICDRVAIPFSYWLPSGAHVVVPASLVERATVLRMVIAHELQHHRQGDTAWLHVFRILTWLCFPNPFMHLWNRRLAQVQEFACDAAIVGGRRWLAADYARCLVTVATHDSRDSPRPRWATPFIRFGDPHVLTRRIEKMLKYKQGSMAKSMHAGIATLLMTSVMAVAYSATGLVQDPGNERSGVLLAVKGDSNAAWPIDNGQVVRSFVANHQGLDIAADAGTEVHSWAAGVVIARGSSKGCGEFVQIQHESGATSRYCNLAGIRVREGETVLSGATIGVIATPPAGVRAHLHFELKMDDRKVDPLEHLPHQPA